MTGIIMLLISLLFACCIWMLIAWLVHMDMTRGHAETVGWANFKTFKRVFNQKAKELDGKGRWERATWSKSFIQSYYEGNIFRSDIYIHASIISFGKKGMLMKTPWDYARAIMYCRKFNKDAIEARKIQW